jgi:hypothetical protein
MQAGKERSSRGSRERRRRSQARNAEDGAKLSMVVGSKINSVFAIFTNTHADQEKRERVKGLFAFKVETETTSDIFNGANISPIDGKNKFALRVEPGQVKRSGGIRDKSIDAAATEERHVRISDA